MHNSLTSSITYPAISNLPVISLYRENAVACSSRFIGSKICDENGLGPIQSSAWTMHNSPSRITYPVISNLLVKSLYGANVGTHSSRLIWSKISNENRLGFIQDSAWMMQDSPSSLSYHPAICNLLVKSVYRKNAAVHSSRLIGSKISDKNRLGMIQGSAWTMQDSPSS
jgi:hypothetical protein